MSNKGYFITGTDTGVGKTVVAVAIIRAIAGMGVRVCGMKPIETGCEQAGQGALIASDGLFLRDASETGESIDNVTPLRFQYPVAPYLAARLEKRDMDMGSVKERFDYLSSRYDALIVEGVGGLYVPIAKDYFVSDMAADFKLPLIIVASPALGSVNHTLLTIDHARHKGLKLAGLVFNYSNPSAGTVAERTNPALIAELAGIPVMGVMPYLESVSMDSVSKSASVCLNIDMLKTGLQ